MRRAGARSTSRVETWLIDDESGTAVKTTLSDDERYLPIAALWNHEILVHRLRDHWRPEQEID